jgi:signal transduction histidine kinase
MDISSILDIVGKLAFGIGSVGLFVYLVKLLTQINQNQKEYNQILKEKFLERERTRDQEISFLKGHYEKESEFMRRQQEALTMNMESEKRLLEQRILLLQEGHRLGVSESVRTEESEQKTFHAVQQGELKGSTVTTENESANTAQKTSLYWAHSLKDSLISMSQEAERLGDDGVRNYEEWLLLYKYIAQLNRISHGIGSGADRALIRVRPIRIQDVLQRSMANLGEIDLIIRIDDSVVDLPLILTDPLLLEHILTELLTNAVEHGEGKEISIRGELDQQLVNLTLSNRVARFFSPPENTALSRFARPFGLSVVETMAHSLGGKFTMSGTDDFFTAVVSLPRSSD